jgi:hypothetical protein
MHLWLTKLMWVLLFTVMPYSITLPTHKPTIGLVTRYGDPGDKLGSGAMACEPHNKVDQTVMGCAHRTLPCGTWLLLENPRTGRRAYCQVMDRGPYGAMHEGKWVIKIRLSDPGKWRGILDITPAVSRALSHNGFETLKVWTIFSPPARRCTRQVVVALEEGRRLPNLF